MCLAVKNDYAITKTTKDMPLEKILKGFTDRAALFAVWIGNFADSHAGQGEQLKSDKVANDYGIHAYKLWVNKNKMTDVFQHLKFCISLKVLIINGTTGFRT